MLQMVASSTANQRQQSTDTGGEVVSSDQILHLFLDLRGEIDSLRAQGSEQVSLFQSRERLRDREIGVLREQGTNLQHHIEAQQDEIQALVQNRNQREQYVGQLAHRVEEMALQNQALQRDVDGVARENIQLQQGLRDRDNAMHARQLESELQKKEDELQQVHAKIHAFSIATGTVAAPAAVVVGGLCFGPIGVLGGLAGSIYTMTSQPESLEIQKKEIQKDIREIKRHLTLLENPV